MRYEDLIWHLDETSLYASLERDRPFGFMIRVYYLKRVDSYKVSFSGLAEGEVALFNLKGSLDEMKFQAWELAGKTLLDYSERINKFLIPV